jgi:hypothetical protein
MFKMIYVANIWTVPFIHTIHISLLRRDGHQRRAVAHWIWGMWGLETTLGEDGILQLPSFSVNETKPQKDETICPKS